jgi:hypothetical protein
MTSRTGRLERSEVHVACAYPTLAELITMGEIGDHDAPKRVITMRRFV